VPITIGRRKEEVLVAARVIEEELAAAGLRVKVDRRDLRPGAKYYYWEMRGVPLRLEVGPRDLDAGQVTAVTRLGDKSTVPRASLRFGVDDLLARFTATLTRQGEEHLLSHAKVVDTMEELSVAIEEGVAIVPWCGERACADFIEKTVNASVLGIEVQAGFSCACGSTCISCGKPGTGALVGRSY